VATMVKKPLEELKRYPSGRGLKIRWDNTKTMNDKEYMEWFNEGREFMYSRKGDRKLTKDEENALHVLMNDLPMQVRIGHEKLPTTDNLPEQLRQDVKRHAKRVENVMELVLDPDDDRWIDYIIMALRRLALSGMLGPKEYQKIRSFQQKNAEKVRKRAAYNYSRKVC
jgi:hypothetical protein